MQTKFTFFDAKEPEQDEHKENAKEFILQRESKKILTVLEVRT